MSYLVLARKYRPRTFSELVGQAPVVQALQRLPGIGQRSALRMVYHLLQHDRSGAQQLASALQHAAQHERHCRFCHTFTEGDICADPARDATRLAVVETPANLAYLERSGAFHGRYFVRMGHSPLDGKGVPAGSELEYVDLSTIAHALAARR